MNKKLIVFIYLILLSSALNTFAQIEENLPTDCVICAQFVPECGPNEVLIPQTCEKCAHCEPLTPLDIQPQNNPTPVTIEVTPETTAQNVEETTCQKCTFHVHCAPNGKCINGCCEIKPKKQKKYNNLKKPQETIKPETKKTSVQKSVQRKTETVTKPAPVKPTLSPKPLATPTAKLKTEKPVDKVCKMPCGSKCCKAGESCITLNQCRGKKNCQLPLLRICTKKKPEPLSGGSISF